MPFGLSGAVAEFTKLMQCVLGPLREEIVRNYFVIVMYEGEYFPGIINDTNSSPALVSAMTFSGIDWIWPKEEDEILYQYEDVMELIGPPKFLNWSFSVPEISKYRK